MPSRDQVMAWLEQVPDPEIPVLSVRDMGIARDVQIHPQQGLVEVMITPTYSGCPAMRSIEIDILKKLTAEGVAKARVTEVLSPAWTTDWITDKGREALRQYGIAPPAEGGSMRQLMGKGEITCPKCGSAQTHQVSEFGSTACKALWKCDSCTEPFEYFKCL